MVQPFRTLQLSSHQLFTTKMMIHVVFAALLMATVMHSAVDAAPCNYSTYLHAPSCTLPTGWESVLCG